MLARIVSKSDSPEPRRKLAYLEVTRVLSNAPALSTEPVT